MAKKKILLVDDSETLCQTMKAAIEENGPFEVFVETNPNLALAAAQQCSPDLIILDILMPKIDGVTLAVHFKGDPALGDIPIMFLTALAEEGNFIYGNVFGGYHVASKGISTDNLIEVINKNLSKSSDN